MTTLSDQHFEQYVQRSIDQWFADQAPKPDSDRPSLDQLAALMVAQNDVLASICRQTAALLIAVKVLATIAPRNQAHELKIVAAFDAASEGLDPDAIASARRLLNLPPKLAVVD
jgi:acetyl-CoA acetyltransferase